MKLTRSAYLLNAKSQNGRVTISINSEDRPIVTMDGRPLCMYDQLPACCGNRLDRKIDGFEDGFNTFDGHYEFTEYDHDGHHFVIVRNAELAAE